MAHRPLVAPEERPGAALETCLRPGCGAELLRTATAPGRGLCPACYKIAWRLVRKGHTTWETLEVYGKCLPPSRKKRKGFGPKAQWFLEVDDG